jgi:hypothetical protein
MKDQIIRKIRQIAPSVYDFYLDTKYNLLSSNKEKQWWVERINDVLSCEDNNYIPRVSNAGLVKNGCQTMHNGIKIMSGSYYGSPVKEMLKRNAGVHEPQEERCFQEVLKYMKPNAVMLELGSYWGFYSMWFHKEVKNPVCYLIEPNFTGLNYGKQNFEMNQMHGNFFHAFVSSLSSISEDGVKIICIDDFVAEQNIQYIDILHSDIQGFEVEMLEGASRTITEDKIGYFFISTHGNDVHEKCRQYLLKHNFKILASANNDETYSSDGLLVAKSASIQGGLEPVSISIKGKN